MPVRGRAAIAGFVAWNQPAEDEGSYNTTRPFLGAYFALENLLYMDPQGDALYPPMVRWIEMVEKKHDWREVAEEKLAELEEFAERMKKMALWCLGVPEDKGSIRPVGDETPSARGAVCFVTGAAQVMKCVVVARRRIEETKTLATRKMMERRAISDALTEDESAERVRRWKIKEREARKTPKDAAPPAASSEPSAA